VPGGDADQGVGAVPWAGTELVPAERVGVAEGRGALDEDEEGSDVVGEEEEDPEPSSSVAVPVAVAVAVAVALEGELSAAVVAGVLVVGADGVDGVVSPRDDALLSSPRVVVPDEWELPTSADTGFCPMSSTPVTMPMARTKMATA
jgi:hypothetical protein